MTWHIMHPRYWLAFFLLFLVVGAVGQLVMGIQFLRVYNAAGILPEFWEARAEVGKDFFGENDYLKIFLLVVTPPIIGLVPAICLGRYVRYTLVDYKSSANKVVRSPFLRMKGGGAKESVKVPGAIGREARAFVRMLPFYFTFAFLSGLEYLLSPRLVAATVIFIGACGLFGYGTYKQIYNEAENPTAND